MRAWWCAVALLLACLSNVQAGSSDAPEVTDASGDVVGPGGVSACPAGCNGPPAFVDLQKGWIDQDGAPEDIIFRIDSGNNANAYGSAEYVFHFEIDGAGYTAGMQSQIANVQSGVPGSGATSPMGVASSATWVDTIITITVPLAAIGDPGPGAVITGTFITSALKNQGQTMFTDRGPNAGFGADYVFAQDAAMAPVPVTHVNVTEGPLEFTHVANETGNASFAIHWTAPANVTLALLVEGNGTLNVTILDAAGVQQFTCLCANGTNVTESLHGEPGPWMIAANYTAFDGSSRLLLQESLSNDLTPLEPDPTGNATGNETLDGAGQDSPLPFIAPAVGLLVAVAARRRR